MSNPGTILLCAGGTGGHLFPAESLAGEMQNRGWTVHLVTDDRANRLAGRFPATGVHVVQSATIAARNPLALARTAFTLFGGFRAAQRLLRQIKPDLAIGFGGYPTLPPMLAASRARIPTMIQEQNAVMGRANRFLAARVDVIAGGFLRPESAGPHGGKVVVTGNPVRPAVLEAAKTPYESPMPTGEFRLLVFGGSQGATYFSHVVPDAVGRLPDELRRRLTIVQQAREEDCRTVAEAYDKLGIKAEVEPFFKNMPERMSQAHMVISRSGASTVSELAVMGRPAILVPFPHALDHDQAANAAALEAKGGALLRPQSGMSGSDLVVIMQSLMEDPDRLSKMASAAKAAGHPEATRLLADQAEAITGRSNPTPSGPARDLKRLASIHPAIKS